MSEALCELRDRYPERVQSALNVLLEAPYFYRDDDEDIYFFLRRHRHEFSAFFHDYFGWTLVMDEKCARVHKGRWYNDRITEANRDMFGFRRRDECLAFMILLEFFEHQLEENSMTVEDRENLRFRFGDLLIYTHRRMRELIPPPQNEKYTEEYVRANMLRQILPVLEKYRFLSRIRPPEDLRLKEVELIFEAMPALYHYNPGRLNRGLDEHPPDDDDRAEQETEADVQDDTQS